MGVIQDSVNQGISVASLIATQSPRWKKNIEINSIKSENKKINKALEKVVESNNLKSESRPYGFSEEMINEVVDNGIIGNKKIAFGSLDESKSDEEVETHVLEQIAKAKPAIEEAKNLSQIIEDNEQRLKDLGDIKTIKNSVRKQAEINSKNFKYKYYDAKEARERANMSLSNAQYEKRNKGVK